MKKLLSILLAVALLASTMLTALAATKADFSDFPNDWSSDALESAIENGLLNGDNGKINPEGKLTRAEMAAILVRAFAFGDDRAADISVFNDVAIGDWFYSEFAKAVGVGLFKGDTGLRPNDSITRQEVAVVLQRAFGLSSTTNALQKFSDYAQIGDWATDAMNALVALGYMTGDTDPKTGLDVVRPEDNITRAEFAQLMYKMIRLYIDEPGVYNYDGSGFVVIRVKTGGLVELTATADGVVITQPGEYKLHVVGNVIVASEGVVITSDSTITGSVIKTGGGDTPTAPVDPGTGGSTTSPSPSASSSTSGGTAVGGGSYRPPSSTEPSPSSDVVTPTSPRPSPSSYTLTVTATAADDEINVSDVLGGQNGTTSVKTALGTIIVDYFDLPLALGTRLKNSGALIGSVGIEKGGASVTGSDLASFADLGEFDLVLTAARGALIDSAGGRFKVTSEVGGTYKVELIGLDVKLATTTVSGTYVATPDEKLYTAAFAALDSSPDIGAYTDLYDQVSGWWLALTNEDTIKKYTHETATATTNDTAVSQKTTLTEITIGTTSHPLLTISINVAAGGTLPSTPAVQTQ